MKRFAQHVTSDVQFLRIIRRKLQSTINCRGIKAFQTRNPGPHGALSPLTMQVSWTWTARARLVPTTARSESAVSGSHPQPLQRCAGSWHSSTARRRGVHVDPRPSTIVCRSESEFGTRNPAVHDSDDIWSRLRLLTRFPSPPPLPPNHPLNQPTTTHGRTHSDGRLAGAPCDLIPL